MSILIKGITIPTHDYIDIRIFPHGKAEINKIRTATRADGTPAFYKTFDVVELPPHGDLIDRDALKVDDGWLDNQDGTQTHIQFVYANVIINAPIIIEAEESKDGTSM